MKPNIGYFNLLLFALVIFNNCAQHNEFPDIKGPYLGQKQLGMTPEVFAPGVISHGFHEHSLTISPDGNDLFYVITDAGYSLYRIIYLRMTNHVWSAPQIAPFSSDYSDLCPLFSPDGKRLYFVSTRPAPGQTKGKDVGRIWYVEKTEDSFGMANYLELPIYPDADIANPSLSANGTLYYQYSYEEKGWDLYHSRFTNGEYGEPDNLGDKINTLHNESAPFIAPDESFLLFHSNRPGGYGGMDIYVSFKQPDGSWGQPINLGKGINSSASDWRPILSSDGKYLFFSSYRTFKSDYYLGKSYKELIDSYRNPQNGTGTLFWIDARILTNLKESASK
jgi:Tol biopolymer transport system component